MLKVNSEERLACKTIVEKLSSLEQEFTDHELLFTEAGQRQTISLEDGPSGSQKRTAKRPHSSDAIYAALEAEKAQHPGFGSEHSVLGFSVKRQKGITGVVNYSCPFRKRNPTRFNVRNYQACALTSFSDITQVK